MRVCPFCNRPTLYDSCPICGGSVSTGKDEILCFFCRRGIPEDSNFCSYCGNPVGENELEILVTKDEAKTREVKSATSKVKIDNPKVKTSTEKAIITTPKMRTATPGTLKEWQQNRKIFIIFCLALLVLGIGLMLLLDLPALFPIFCFICLAACFAAALYSHSQVNRLKKQLKENGEQILR